MNANNTPDTIAVDQIIDYLCCFHPSMSLVNLPVSTSSGTRPEATME